MPLIVHTRSPQLWGATLSEWLDSRLAALRRPLLSPMAEEGE